MEEIGAPTAYLNQATVIQVQGRHAFSRMGKLKLAGWLAETEMRHRIVLYVVDTPVSSPWTQTAIRQVGVFRRQGGEADTLTDLFCRPTAFYLLHTAVETLLLASMNGYWSA